MSSSDSLYFFVSSSSDDESLVRSIIGGVVFGIFVDWDLDIGFVGVILLIDPEALLPGARAFSLLYLFLKSLRGSSLSRMSGFGLVSEHPSLFRLVRRDLESDSIVNVDLIVIHKRLTQFVDYYYL